MTENWNRPHLLGKESLSIERMSGKEIAGGDGLFIRYQYGESPFGQLLVASTDKGICYLAFDDDRKTALAELMQLFPNARYGCQADDFQQQALALFQGKVSDRPLALYVKGTDFQVAVWEALLDIPVGEVITYGEVARKLNRPKACRAVGSAVGANPVAFFIPCHRVIRSDGSYGEYHWGSDRKAALIQWEKSSISL